MGLVVFGAIILYLLISIAVVISATIYARKHGKSAKRWGAGAALVMYLLVFWDHIPTLVTHKYYCEKEAGFWVYKTLDQWKAENPGVMEKMVAAQPTITHMPYGDLRVLDERFAIETRRGTPIPLLSTKIFEDRLVDRMTGEVLAKGIDIGSGYGELAVGGDSWQVIKFWLKQKPCVTSGVRKLSTELQNMRGKK